MFVFSVFTYNSAQKHFRFEIGLNSEFMTARWDHTELGCDPSMRKGCRLLLYNVQSSGYFCIYDFLVAIVRLLMFMMS